LPLPDNCFTLAIIFKNPIPLPARNGVSFYPGHRPPFGLGVNGYLVEGYKLKGIIPNWKRLSRGNKEVPLPPTLSSQKLKSQRD
jgi:hypothetical protein